MFRHKGKSRTYIHNFRLASILSFVAGIVNISGVLSVKVLTTNVTGHFAYFAEDLSIGNYTIAVIHLLFILSFLIGAFVSNLLVEIISRKSIVISYTLPMAIEILALSAVALCQEQIFINNAASQVIACVLLFAMGLQNALVTKVSQSVVRTTHLTGLFTDLGIELSQLFFRNSDMRKQQIKRSIRLKIAIISCFFTGGLAGALIYSTIQLKTLLIAVCALLFALFYDNMLLHYYNIKRKIRTH